MANITKGYITDTINGIAINSSIKASSTNYTNYTNRDVKYVVIHYTGNSSDYAKSNAVYFSGKSRKASAHFFVDDKNIYQSVELRDSAWHCGCSLGYKTECRNNNSIGIEMCTSGNYLVSNKTQINAAYLCANMCKLLGITSSMVDTYVLRHYDCVKSNKSCPAQFVKDQGQWNDFKSMVKNILNTGSVTTTATTATVVSTVSNSKCSNTVLNVTANIKGVQKYLNTYYDNEIKSVLGSKLTVDGFTGKKTLKAITVAIQVELNCIGANLVIDGNFGSASKDAFTKYVGCIKKGNKNIFVTLWQCYLVCNKLDPNGIDGKYGNGCVIATNKLFSKYDILQDSVISGEDLNKIM